MLTQVQTRRLRLGLFQSICPSIKYQLEKTNVVADVLSRSQRKYAEDSIDNSAVARMEIEEKALELSGISVELTIEDL